MTATAFDRLAGMDYTDLADWCYESHKDFYGVKGRHMQGWTKAELISWIQSHFVFDHDEKTWRNAVPFIGEDEDYNDGQPTEMEEWLDFDPDC